MLSLSHTQTTDEIELERQSVTCLQESPCVSARVCARARVYTCVWQLAATLKRVEFHSAARVGQLESFGCFDEHNKWYKCKKSVDFCPALSPGGRKPLGRSGL